MSNEPTGLGIEAQIEKLERIADPATRSIAMDLLAAVLKLHADGLERMLSIVQEHSQDADALLSAFRGDRLIRALLLLHDLSDEAPDVRVRQTLTELEPQLKRWGATVNVLHLDESGATISLSFNGHSCGSTAESIRELVERQILESAPELNDIHVRIEAETSPVLIPVNAIQPAAPQQASGAPAVRK
jgi:Fe-S cluster biogenesis protein NfuA